MRFLPLLLATTAIALPTAAMAAPDTAQPAADAPTGDEGGDIIVTGNRETRQVQQLTSRDFARLLPGTSPLKATEKLPSVNFLAADAFGLYEWSQRVSIRGFNQNQIGFTLDGIPLGDGSYGNTNGLHISRAISSENIARVQVSQGAGSIGTQATNNLGGTLEFFSNDPTPEFGLTLNGTGGSYNTAHVYGRLDTGALTSLGAAFFVSFQHTDLDKWKGFGRQRQNQLNAKLIAPFGFLTAVGTFNYSERRENDYQDLSLDIIQRLGYNWDNISNNFPLAVQIADVAANRGDSGAPRLNQAAGTVYPAPIQTVDDAYFDAAGVRNDYLASFGVETPKELPVKVAVRGYYHSNHGQGTWFTPYVPSINTLVPISIRTTEYDIRRKGVFGSLGFQWKFNDFSAGFWYENNDFRQARRFYELSNRVIPNRSAREFQEIPFFTQWYWQYNTETVQYHVQDKISLGALTLNFGWKGFDVRNRATPIIAGGFAQGSIGVRDWFQPHAGINYKIGQIEGFFGYTEATRAFTSAATSGPFATTQAGFNALGQLRPETSKTYEAGLRYSSARFQGSVVGYYVDFNNRLLAFTQGAGIIGNPAILQNVGSVRSAGVELAGELKLPYRFSLFATYSYNDSTYQNDVVDRSGTLVARTRGRTVVDAPRDLAKGEIRYDGRLFYGRLGVNYTGRRFVTYENDISVPSFTLVDLTIGVPFNWPGIVKGEVQFNATNLTDERYIATIGTNGFVNRGDFQTLLTGAPQQFFATFKTRF